MLTYKLYQEISANTFHRALKHGGPVAITFHIDGPGKDVPIATVILANTGKMGKPEQRELMASVGAILGRSDFNCKAHFVEYTGGDINAD